MHALKAHLLDAGVLELLHDFTGTTQPAEVIVDFLIDVLKMRLGLACIHLPAMANYNKLTHFKYG